jgi:cell division protease FtsH
MKNLPKDRKERRNAIVALIVLVALVISPVIYGAWKQHATRERLALTESPIEKEMRNKPDEWLKTEKDVSYLASDLRANTVTTVGLGNHYVLVSSATNKQYFVSESPTLSVSNLVLSTLKEVKDSKLKRADVVMLQSGTASALSAEKWLRDFGNIIWIAMMVGMGVSMMRQFGIGGDTSKIVKDTGVRFKDVIGASEAKEAMNDVVQYLKDPKRYAAIGARPSSGVMALGSPGTGKTLLAKAVAGECGVPFIAINGSSFSSPFVGAGIAKIRQVFRTARKHAPCIVFIDELDGLGKRSSQGDSVTTENNRMLNQILVEMDGFKSGDGIVVIAATNLLEHIDEALLREGRFDRKIYVHLPTVAERTELFKYYGAKVKLASDVDFDQLGRVTTGMSPASIESVVNQAALIAVGANRPTVSHADIVEAIEVSQMGKARSETSFMTPELRELTAYHEAGHAVIAQALGVGRVEKVTIIPRGGALGVTLVTQDDEPLRGEKKLAGMIEMLFGGRCAEVLIYGEASTGAGNDLKRASEIALSMVAKLGMGGQRKFFSIDAVDSPILASGEMTESIGRANRLLDQLEERCAERLEKYREALEEVTKALLEHETIEGSVVAAAVARVDAANAMPVSEAAATEAPPEMATAC